MLKRLLIILLVVSMTYLPCPSTKADEFLETLINEDFSSCELSSEFTDDLNHFESGNISVEDERLKLTFPEGNTSRTVRLYPTLPSSLTNQRVTVEFDLCIEGAMESRQFIFRDSADVYYYPLCIHTNGKAAIGTNTGSNTGFTFETGIPYGIKLDFYNNTDSCYTDVYIDGSYLGTSEPPSGWNGKKLNRIYFLMQRSAEAAALGKESTTYIDNLTIKASPERVYLNTQKSVDLRSLRFLNNEKQTCFLEPGVTRVIADAHTSPGTELSLILARYKKDGKALVLSDVDAVPAAADAKGRAQLAAELTAESVNGEFVKVFLMDNMSYLSPITPVSYLFPRPDTDLVSHPICQGQSGRESYLTLIGIEERERIKSETRAQLETALSEYTALSEADFAAAVRAMLKYKPYIDQKSTGLMLICERLATLYDRTGDEKYSRYCAIALYETALNYQTRARLYYDSFFGYMNIVPASCVYAYDMIYNSPGLAELSAEYGCDIEEIIGNYIFAAAMDTYLLYNEKQLTNISVYAIRNGFLAGATLNSPELIRLYIGWIDKLMSGEHYYSDGMWEEGTLDYHKQVTDGIALYVNCLNRCYADIPGYADPIMGLTLPDENLKARWPMLAKAAEIYGKMRYPNGDPIPVNDTDAHTTGGSVQGDYLENVELPGFKHYSLTSGDTSEAMSVSLNFDAQSTQNGHKHLDYLNLTLWGAGAELLPDSGYPRGTDSRLTRFFRSPHAHNTAWVWNENTDYTRSKDTCNASAILAYDDGRISGKDIQLIEASQTGQGADYADIKQRAVMTVRLADNRFYAIDLWRLKGGNAHELYLRSSEDESVTLSTQSTLDNTGYATLRALLEASGNTAGLDTINGVDYPGDLCTNPRELTSEGDYSFSWQGNDTGSGVQIFQNGAENTRSIFSEIPSLRRADADDNKALQLYRRRLVSPTEVTKFASVYEPIADGNTGLIRSVEWAYPSDPSDMAIAARITTDDFTDIIYFSNDTTARTVFDAELSGRYAFVRIQNDAFKSGYLYSEGSVSYKGVTLKGNREQSFDILSASGFGEVNSLTVSGQADITAPGSYVICKLDNNFGYGYKVCSAGGNTIYIDSAPAFKIKDGRAQLMYHDGLYLNENAQTGKYTYTMFDRREFESPRAYVTAPVYKVVS